MLFPKIFREKSGKWGGQWLDTQRQGSRLVWAIGNAGFLAVVCRMAKWYVTKR